MDRTNYKGIYKIKVKSWFLKLCIIIYIIISSSTYPNAGEVSCRYYSDHNKQENIGMMSEIVGGIADLFTGGAASTISHGASAVGLASQVNDHKIYCVYTINKDDQENSDKMFYELIKSKEIIPIFLYENLAKKIQNNVNFLILILLFLILTKEIKQQRITNLYLDPKRLYLI